MDELKKIQQLEDKIKLLQEQVKAQQYAALKSSRKERTRRLIQTGALAEKYMEIPEDTSLELREAFFAQATKVIRYQ